MNLGNNVGHLLVMVKLALASSSVVTEERSSRVPSRGASRAVLGTDQGRELLNRWW